jgi:hypothetical protein
VTLPEVIATGPDTPQVRARFPVVAIAARAMEQLVRLVDLRATGDGRTCTRWDLVVRLDAADHVQAIECLNRLFLPTSADL